MRPAISLIVRLLLVCLAVGACAGGPRKPDTSAAFAPQIEALNRRLEERFRAGDMLGVADLYADDGMLLSGDERVAGREAIDAYWSEMTNPVDWRLEVFETGGSEELAYQRGRSYLTRRRDGAEHTSVVDFMLIWKKDADGDWKIAVDAYW